MNTKIITLDINKKIFEPVIAKQGDTASRFLLFNLFDNGVAFNLTGRSVRAYAIKPDNNLIYNNLVINDAVKGICTLELTTQMLAVEGFVNMELVITEGTKKLSSIPFILRVIASLNGDNAVISTNEFTVLQEALASIQNIDNRFEEVNSSLETIANEKNTKTLKKRKAFITVIDDDGRDTFFTNGHYDVIKAHPNAKISMAVNPYLIGQSGYITTTQLNQLKADAQFEFINHGNLALPSNKSEAQIKQSFEDEKSWFLANGLTNYEYYVYNGYNAPDCISNGNFKNIMKKYYKCVLANVGSKPSYIPFEAMEVKRYSAYANTYTIDYINWCIDNNAWCVIFGHSYMADQTSAKLESTLAYIDSKVAEGLIEYVTVKEMVDNYSNVIDLGNGVADSDYFILDRNGNVDFSIGGEPVANLYKSRNVYFEKTNYFSNLKTPDDYIINTITYEVITSSECTKYGMGDGLGGIVETVFLYDIAVTAVNNFIYQIYHELDSGKTAKRYWKLVRGEWIWTPWCGIDNANKRPRYATIGATYYDTTLNKPIYCKTKGCYANKTWTASTNYVYGDVVLYSGYPCMCFVEGTTGTTQSSVNTTASFVDGTSKWVYLFTSATWVDATGTTV